jgi:hypothetical protein
MKKPENALSFPMGLALLASPLLAQIQGPGSSASPYLVPTAAGVEITSILSAGDTVRHFDGGTQIYRMTGTPDGLGAFDNDRDDEDDWDEGFRGMGHARCHRDEGTFTVVMNHELTNAEGVARDHGGKGAFVSRWTLRKSDLKVVDGVDQMQHIRLWNPATSSYYDTTGVNFTRFCSADLAQPGAYYNPKTGLGTKDRLYLNGEETSGGRALAHIVTGRYDGTTYEFTGIGRAAWENLLASPYPQDKTIVIGDEDATPGAVYVYVGMKRSTGNSIERAGLVGGARFGIAVQGIAAEDRLAGIPAGARFALVAPTDPAVTKFWRPEDGAWDTRRANRYYFVTTDRYDQVKDGLGGTVGRSRLWRLTFDDIGRPEAGGKIEMLLDGTEAQNMLDNIAVDGKGKLILLEDVGGATHNGKVFSFDPDTRALVQIAKHDPARFGDIAVPPGPGFNQDEESSGVIDISDIVSNTRGYDTRRYNYFLIVDQAHVNVAAGDPAIVEKGQFLMIKAPR